MTKKRKRRWRRSKKADRELERREREIAKREEKARSESEKRQERIKVLWEELQKELEPVKELAKDGVGATLLELVSLQKAAIEHMRRFHQLCEWAKTHAPEKLESIESAHFRELEEKISLPESKLTPKQWSERTRQGYNWRGVGLIEHAFGGKGEACWRKSTVSGALSALRPSYEPTCIDDILRGGFGEVKVLPDFAGGPPITIVTRTNMERLEELFGIHRNRLSKYLRRFENAHNRRGYDYRAVVAIMDGLLNEPEEHKSRTRGAPRRIWLSDADLRTRVLNGIAARLNSLSVEEDIKTAFLTVIHRHLPDSA